VLEENSILIKHPSSFHVLLSQKKFQGFCYSSRNGVSFPLIENKWETFHMCCVQQQFLMDFSVHIEPPRAQLHIFV